VSSAKQNSGAASAQDEEPCQARIAAWPYVSGVWSTEYPLLLTHLDGIFSRLANERGAKSLRDVGSGHGWAVPIAKCHFSDVKSFDPDSDAVEFIQGNYGVEALQLSLSVKTAPVICDGDVLLFSHLFYYIPRCDWTAILRAVVSNRSHRKHIIFCMWSRACQAYKLGSSNGGRSLPSAEDLYSAIFETLGCVVATYRVRAKHFVPRQSVSDMLAFLSLQPPDYNSQMAGARTEGGCVNLASYKEFTHRQSAGVTTVSQDDVIIVAEYKNV
jgi:hypothetical protein